MVNILASLNAFFNLTEFLFPIEKSVECRSMSIKCWIQVFISFKKAWYYTLHECEYTSKKFLMLTDWHNPMSIDSG